MKQLYQDGMAICRHYGRPDFFVTFTCNPKWDEIISNIPAGSNATDHPDIVSRVFNLKLKALIDDLLHKHVLGKTVADVYVVEFQKRGLPHAHILLIMNQDDKIRDLEDIDDTICAEIPDRNIDPDLYNIVSRNMMHGPCGSGYPNSPCMTDGKCSKRYPRQFCDETMANEDGYPIYRRRRFVDGEERKVKCKGVWLDNRWVVPYCPFLSKHFNAHINVEICSSISAFKYLFKYVFKGGDRMTAVLENEVNEIKDYVDARYLSAPEAVWHIFGFKFHHRSPAIQRLQIHLPNEQTVTFNDDTDIVTLLQNDRIRKTTLTEFFTANKQATEATINGEQLDFDCRELLYQEFPTHMVWKQGLRRWNRRKNGIGSTIGRMYFVGPSGGERFYLRMLLTIVKGAMSFEDLRTYDGVVHQNFKSTCIARGLLDSDDQWDRSLTEAALWQGGFQLRQLFVCILLHCQPADPLELWRNHSVNLADDCKHQLQTKHQIDDLSEEQIYYSHIILMFHILMINRSNHSLCASFVTFCFEIIPISISMIFPCRHMNLHQLISILID
ncbi:MAG: hypothetical protein E6H10_14970 [Bacteroidetes bacterium]|nr:MAG: hypothetical protein E6H10_14970 [Bacteroidota bacterium]